MNRPPDDILRPLLERAATLHRHLCPRQVLGLRLGLAGLKALGFVDGAYLPFFANDGKRLLTVVETDGCGADGVAVATDCWVGRRTLRVYDMGKVATTLVDTATGQSLRLHPCPEARELAMDYAPEAPSRWHAYLLAYQRMPDDVLMCIQPVALTRSLEEILSRPEARVICAQCGEEIINERESSDLRGRPLCQTCAGNGYYRPASRQA